MRTRTPLLVLIAGAVLALAPAASAATPFTAGTGGGVDLAVGSDGKGHVVWTTDEADDRIGYCRVPAGGMACELTQFLPFPGAASQSPSPHPQVFTPAANKVVVLASCTQCTTTSTDTYRFISATTNGTTFAAPIKVGDTTAQMNGQSAYVNTGD